MFARLTDDVTRPPRQVVLTTKERRELSEFPVPAYELAQIDRYLLGSIQFSSGCPYQCEFCDIPALYGRVARYKSPEQVCAELDKLVACGLSTSVYFVDDNFIANKRAVREMLPHLIEWQKRNGYAYLSDAPGLGVDINEELAAKYPCDNSVPEWTLARLPDGTSFTP